VVQITTALTHLVLWPSHLWMLMINNRKNHKILFIFINCFSTRNTRKGYNQGNRDRKSKIFQIFGSQESARIRRKLIIVGRMVLFEAIQRNLTSFALRCFTALLIFSSNLRALVGTFVWMSLSPYSLENNVCTCECGQAKQ